MKRLNQTFAALGCVLLLASPALALEALNEEEMDGITASGDPVVLDVKAQDEALAVYSDDSHYQLDFNVANGQKGLRALTLQNIVGEAQIVTNLNVASMSGLISGTDQSNFSAQSWGSTLPDPDTVKTVGRKAEGKACTGVIACNGGLGLIGGDAPKFVVAGAAVDTKISEAASASADTIIRAESEKSKAVVAMDNSSKYGLAFNEEEAQKDLSALFITNLVGRAQLALNLNILAGGLGLVPGSTESFATPGNGSTASIRQHNTGIQFRGTPLVGSTGTSGGLTATAKNF